MASRILNINCWNEWTEGSYLEPDKVHGDSYLKAVRHFFKLPKNDKVLYLLDIYGFNGL